MKKTRTYILLILIATACSSISAQNGINSPFSQYGIGYSNLPYNMPAASALGGVVYSRSAFNSINPFHPASYAAIG